MEKDYSTIHYDAFSKKPHVRLVDIGMLGAHDAFTCLMDETSKADPASKSPVHSDLLLKNHRPFFIRMSKAQLSDSYTLLRHGVRFFDARVSTLEDGCYCKHGLLSGRLDFYIEGILRFLAENTGEIVVFCIQHCHFIKGKTTDDMLKNIAAIKVDGKCLFDYVHYSSDTPIGQLTYGDITKDGASSGVVFLCEIKPSHKYNGTLKSVLYNSEDTTRKVWHTKMRPEHILPKIAAECEYIENHFERFKDLIRINQAQLSLSFSPIKGVKAMLNEGWSLISAATHWNPKCVEHPDFSRWLKAMPVLFLDNTNSDYLDFNNKVMAKIADYNASLG